MRNWMFEIFGFNTGFVSKDTFSHPRASNILRHRDIDGLKSLMNSCPINWNERYFFSLAMSRHFPHKKLRAWVDSEPSSSDAHLVYGARLLKLAWDARGYGRGNEVDEKRWIKFFELLDQTESVLLDAAKLNEDDPTPWVYLIMVSVYRSGQEDLEQLYFDEAIRRDQENWHAHINRLTGLSEKYGGSHEEMFNFAREVDQKALEGSLLHCLVLKAHSEYWKYKLLFEDKIDEAEAYRINQPAINECLKSYNASLAVGNHKIIDSLFARINAAGTFYIFRQIEPLKRELEVLGDSIEDIHWRWVGTEGALTDAKRLAMI